MAASRSNGDALGRLRAWWLHRQGLTPATAPKTIEACVERAGWLSTSGSAGVYLSIRARMPGAARAAIDRAAVDGVSVIEVPGAHARPAVLVPRSEMALALRLHAATFQKHLAPLFASGRMRETELRGLAAQVCRLLDEGPRSSADLRKSLTHPAAAELLRGALNDLALRGIVRRFPVDGRLDSANDLYELRHPEDRPMLAAEGDAAAIVTKAVEHALRRHGPATLDELTWWGGFTKGAARTALAVLRAESFGVAGWTDEAWLLSSEMPAWRSFTGSGENRVVLLPFRDPFTQMRRGPVVLARKSSAPVLDGALARTRLADVGTLSHHAILSGGDLVGVWEYDPNAATVVTRLWESDAALQRRVAATAAETARFIRDQIGNARLSAVDPPPASAKRLAFCRSRGVASC